MISLSGRETFLLRRFLASSTGKRFFHFLLKMLVKLIINTKIT